MRYQKIIILEKLKKYLKQDFRIMLEKIHNNQNFFFFFFY